MAIAVTLHVLAAVIWVGGMFFAYFALRPAAQGFEPAVRLPLWTRAFSRFFFWVWISVLLLPASGYWMIFRVLGGMGHLPHYVNIMQGLGIIMILTYLHVFFAPYRRMRQAVVRGDWPEAGRRLGQIRRLVLFNLALGLATITLAVWSSHAR